MRKTLALLGLACCAALLPASANYSLFEKKLSRDQQVLHALGRLTFGPRPGDVAAVTRMGLKKWIDLQLHPERIKENPELEKHLAPLATLGLTQAEIAAEYPRPAVGAAVAAARQARALRDGTPEQTSQAGQALPAVRNQAGAGARNSQQVLVTDLSQGKLYRAIFSNRQLRGRAGGFLVQPFQCRRE